MTHVMRIVVSITMVALLGCTREPEERVPEDVFVVYAAQEGRGRIGVIGDTQHAAVCGC